MDKKIIAIGILILSTQFIFSQEKKEQAKEKEKEQEIEEVVMVKKKKAVEQKVDRTVFDFSEQPNLTSGSTIEGLNKLPGFSVSETKGMSFEGKPLEVYMDGNPLGISSTELKDYLEGIPASSIEKIEMITQPGAEFPATSGGAILNIVTSKSAKNYLSANYAGGYGFYEHKDEIRHRFNNSISLNAKNKLFSWQLNIGQYYGEWVNEFSYVGLTNAESFGISKSYFVRSGVGFNLGKDRLLLNYNINDWGYKGDMQNEGITTIGGIDYPSFENNKSKNNGLRHEAVATYQKKFNDDSQKLDFKLMYTHRDSDFKQINHRIRPLGYSALVADNGSSENITTFKTDYSKSFDEILDGIKLNLGGLYQTFEFKTENRGLRNMVYNRQTASSYVELQARINKFDITLGTRAEGYDIYGKVDGLALIPFEQFRFFPNGGIQYSFTKKTNLKINYNKKISLPGTWALNPNNTNNQTENSTQNGNPNLKPIIYNNYDAKLNLYGLLSLGYGFQDVNNRIIQEITRTGNKIDDKRVNFPKMKYHDININLTLPFSIFKDGLVETAKSDPNPDKGVSLNVYANYFIQDISGIDSKGMWNISTKLNVNLPKGIKLNANYRHFTKGGTWDYFLIEKEFNNTLDISLSKKFNKDRLSLTIYGNNLLSSTDMLLETLNQTPGIVITNKRGFRSFGLSVNYKIPTRNKLAKEESDMIHSENND